MSTTKFMTSTGSNRELHIKRSNEDHVQIRQFDPEFHTHQAKTFFLNPSEAPALALAILEAAGVESPYFNLGEAVDNLRQHVEREAKHAAGARERAELEAEALELFNAQRKHQHYPLVEDWDMQPSCKDTWLAVAHRAREIGAEK